jgi:5-formyltetrahydrofolate cyclo-ligase
LNKKTLREELKKARQELSEQRRKEAAEELLTSFLPSLASYASVLSFASLSHEIDTSLLNRFLADTGRLLFPGVVKTRLKIYRILNLEKQLEVRAFGLFEPIPAKCKEVALNEIEIVLVPALGFDKFNHRIGYGKGFYDRFLASLTDCPTVGIGFKEQLVDTLPTTSTDFPLSRVTLF